MLVKNFSRISAMQRELDDYILEKHNIDEKVASSRALFSFVVECGELSNEWGSFKYWKATPPSQSGLVEEFADGLHFLVSYANKLNFRFNDYEFRYDFAIEREGADEVDRIASQIMYVINIASSPLLVSSQFYIGQMFDTYFTLAHLLGFKYEEVESAYIEKNKKNVQRQLQNY